MKKHLLIILISMLSHVSLAQTKVSEAEKRQVIEKFDRVSASMKSMQCTFTQKKTNKLLSRDIVSRGVMYYAAPSKLRWQYTSPYDYTFIINGDNVSIKSTKKTQQIKVSENKIFRQITSIILSTITGGSISKSKDFSVEIWKSGNGYFAKLYPKKKEVKQIYKVIELTFTPRLTMISTVKMVEKTGDATIVTLNNVKLNTRINENLFTTK